MEPNLRKIIDNKLILKSPSTSFPEIISCIFLMEPMFKIFQEAIEFDCLFLTIFQKFLLICELYF